MKQQFVKLLLFLGGISIVALILSVLLQSCTPVRYVYIDPKDSVVKKQRVVYDNLYIPTPLYFNYYRTPYYYNPFIIQRQKPIVVPQRPTIQPNRWSRPLQPRPHRN